MVRFRGFRWLGVKIGIKGKKEKRRVMVVGEKGKKEAIKKEEGEIKE